MSDAAVVASPNDTPRFRRTRLRVFVSIVVGYACYYLTRNSLTYVAPVMVEASSGLALDITAIGLITSLFPLCYGVSKFVAGVLGDILDPRALLSGGLLVTACANLAFGASSAMPVFCALWCLNGVMQGCGAPSCAKILTAWFASGERGTYWGLWNLSHNVGGFCAPILAGTAARSLGWRAGFFAPGLVGIVVAMLVFATARPTPESVGFKAVEEPLVAAPAEAAGANAAAGKVTGSLGIVLRDVRIWLLALSYMCVYAIRQGVTSWSVFYLLETGRAGNAASAALRVTGLELGGLAGSLVAGAVSDRLVSRCKTGDGRVGRRIRVVCAYLVGVAAALAAVAHVPAGSAAAQWLSIAAVGFFLYGPQMLIGLCGAELVGRNSVGASEGFLGLIAYIGAAMAGLPLSKLVQVCASARGLRRAARARAEWPRRAPPLLRRRPCHLTRVAAPAPAVLCPWTWVRAARATGARVAHFLQRAHRVHLDAVGVAPRPGECKVTRRGRGDRPMTLSLMRQ